MSKLSASVFAKFLLERASAKDGYIMGSRGQNPRTWGANSWWFTQYRGGQRRKALYWRANAEYVWDCQGLAEGYINQKMGKNIDVRARNNYAEWCEAKGKGVIPAAYRVPGAAVFKANSSGPIHHVGYLVEPVEKEKPNGDWWVVEAKGVMYGVVKTRLLQDKYWNRWGLMTRYFDYEKGASAFELGERALELGCVGSDVRALQGMLIELGFNLGSYGADGDFGAATHKAVEAFQTKYRLPVTGRMEKSDFETLNDAFLPEDPDAPEPDAPEPDAPEPDAPEPDAPAPEEPDAPAASYEIDALDLSSYNSTQFPKIDWEKIKRNVGFLVLRCGCTRRKNKPLGVGGDVAFEKWAKKCNELGIPFWAYYYSNPNDADQAREEARFAYDVAEKYHPVGYCMDCEEASLGKAKIEAWFDEIKKLGAKRTMLYLGHNWVPVYKLPTDAGGFIAVADAIWIPRYGKNDGTRKDKYVPKYPCDLWQYTSVKSFGGIPDKTLDANVVTDQRKTMAWFRGEA